MINPIEDIPRIICMWRRYEGLRNAKHGKIWLAQDLDELERRILQYLKTPSKFNWNKGIVPEESEDSEPSQLTGVEN